MPRTEILPHLTAPRTAWTRGGWMLALDGQPLQPAPKHLPGWDYDSVLEFNAETVVDLKQIHTSCGTSEDAVFELVCLWDCPATGRRIVAARHELSGREKKVMRSEFEVPPRTVAERIRVERQVVLSRNGSGEVAPFAPSTPGSVLLWERPDEIASVALEGTGGRFPVEAVDFARQNLPDAVWWLSLAYDDPDDSFLASARLYINSAHPAISEMLEEPSSSAARRTLSVIQWDASRRVLTEVSDDPRMQKGPFEEGSVGAVVERLCLSILQHHDLPSVFSLVRNDRDRFERLLQDKLRLLRDD